MQLFSAGRPGESGSVLVKIWGILSWCLLIVLVPSCFIAGIIFLLSYIFELSSSGYYPDDLASIKACIDDHILATEDLKSVLRVMTLSFAAYIIISTVFVYPRVLEKSNEPSPFKWYTSLGIAVLLLVLIPAAFVAMYYIMFRFGGSPYNAWTHLFGAAVVVFLLFFIFIIFRVKRKEIIMFKRRGMSCFLLAAMALSIILFEYGYTFGDFDSMPVEETGIKHAIVQCKLCASQYLFVIPVLNLLFVVYIISTLAWMNYRKQDADGIDAPQ